MNRSDKELIGLMLNNKPDVQYVDRNITITAPRQSTSDDARLLRDLEKEAENRVTSVFFSKLESSNIECLEIHKEINCMTRSRRDVYIMFILNGEKFKEKVSIEEFDWNLLPKTEKLKEIYKLISEGIAKLLIEKYLRSGGLKYDEQI
jgi:hypothetical protein